MVLRVLLLLLLLLLRLRLLQLLRLQQSRAGCRWRCRSAHGRVLAILAPPRLDQTAVQRMSAEANDGMRRVLMRVQLEKGKAAVRLSQESAQKGALVARATHLHSDLQDLAVSGKQDAEVAGAGVRREIAHVWR